MCILKEDCGGPDPTHIFCQVLEEAYPNRYRLQTINGVLKNHYPTNCLLQVPLAAAENIEIPYEELSEKVTLHAEAAKISTSTWVTISCNCKGPQCIGRCRCVKNQVSCSIYYHATEFDCGNFGSLELRTELAMVPRVAIAGTSHIVLDQVANPPGETQDRIHEKRATPQKLILSLRPRKSACNL